MMVHQNEVRVKWNQTDENSNEQEQSEWVSCEHFLNSFSFFDDDEQVLSQIASLFQFNTQYKEKPSLNGEQLSYAPRAGR